MLNIECNLQLFLSSLNVHRGLSCSTVGATLGIKVKVIVPETTKAMMQAKIRATGADVVVHGKNWNEADELARKLVRENPEAQYISPFDHPLLWEGHSTIIDELASTLADPPSHIVASVGGGGLLCGVLEGLARHAANGGWGSRGKGVGIVAAETKGADSFAGAWQNGGDKAFRLPAISSIASSLGALQVTPALLDRARAHGGPLSSAVCTDAEAVDAVARFLNDHRILVEPACGAALAVAYSPRLRAAHLGGATSVVLEVCGGSAVNLELLTQWRKDLPME